MRYVRVNDNDYVLVPNKKTAGGIVREWLRVKRMPADRANARRWQILRLNANGTATVLAHDDVPRRYTDFDIIEIGDNA